MRNGFGGIRTFSKTTIFHFLPIGGKFKTKIRSRTQHPNVGLWNNKKGLLQFQPSLPLI
jgi:hypothetical protein